MVFFKINYFRKKELTRAPFGLGTVPTYGLYDVVAKAYTQVLQVFDEVGSPTTELMVTRGCPCDGDHRLSPRGYHRLSPCGYVHRMVRHRLRQKALRSFAAPRKWCKAKLLRPRPQHGDQTPRQCVVCQTFLPRPGLEVREAASAEIWPQAEIVCCPVTSSLSSSSDIDQ